ncbi:N-acetylmuramoyl-L-alanine amidase CwlD [Paenibacillus senegalensis]|uniref:N-acetylmuramoyl-L-alanine amidase CwlD n=1 Tax=Paenibacillus senegalensis TaxID=1465766 RepID=UPI000289BE32|nr:N-acetylmuramoyl-L-alanine amidase CwlD [Paenibacillus senegalensis]
MRKFPRGIVFWLNLNGSLKLLLGCWIVALLVYLFTFELPSARTWSYWTLPLSGKVIALDPGHGGVDGGAVSKDGLIEKDVTLSLALYLRDYLQEAGAIVVMTRETDKDLASPGTKGLSKRKTEDLLNRADFIESHKADMLVSLHLNAIPSARWRGAQTFYYSGGQALSKPLAAHIQDELTLQLQNTDRVAQTADTVYLLKTLPIPSVLVEAGFLSNPEEAALLSQDDYQRKVAAAIYQGILKYYSGETVGEAN